MLNLETFSEYHRLKIKHLTIAQANFDLYSSTNNKKYWELFLEEQWRANMVDDLDADFFRTRTEKRKTDQDYYKQKYLEEVTYQKGLEDNLKNTTIASELAWYEACLENCFERQSHLIKKIDFLTEVKEDGNIIKARQYPINELIEFKQGKAKCIWHQEKTPSMKYYPATNSVYCFGCEKHGDVIDVAMTMFGISFKEAIKKLS